MYYKCSSLKDTVVPFIQLQAIPLTIQKTPDTEAHVALEQRPRLRASKYEETPSLLDRPSVRPACQPWNRTRIVKLRMQNDGDRKANERQALAHDGYWWMTKLMLECWGCYVGALAERWSWFGVDGGDMGEEKWSETICHVTPAAIVVMTVLFCFAAVAAAVDYEWCGFCDLHFWGEFGAWWVDGCCGEDEGS